MAQRQNRQRKKDENCEDEDIEFIETLGKPAETRDEAAIKPSEEVGGESSVVVVDIKQETQNLEDWLDDFLDD